MLWQIQYGISDQISIGAGTTPWGLPSSFNIKGSNIIADNAAFAVGWFWVGDLFGVASEELYSLINMPYFAITSGNKEDNITIAGGYNFSTDNNDFEWTTNRLVLNIGGTVRTARRFALVFEGWLINDGDEYYTMGGPGIRYFRKINRVTAKNGAGARTWDFQLMHLPGMEFGEGPFFLPMFGASQKF